MAMIAQVVYTGVLTLASSQEHTLECRVPPVPLQNFGHLALQVFRMKTKW